MSVLLSEAEFVGSIERKTKIYNAVTSISRANGKATVQAWYKKYGKKNACKRNISLIDSGAYNISSNTPVYDELEGLVAWAKQ